MNHEVTTNSHVRAWLAPREDLEMLLKAIMALGDGPGIQASSLVVLMDGCPCRHGGTYDPHPS